MVNHTSDGSGLSADARRTSSRLFYVRVSVIPPPPPRAPPLTEDRKRSTEAICLT